MTCFLFAGTFPSEQLLTRRVVYVYRMHRFPGIPGISKANATRLMGGFVIDQVLNFLNNEELRHGLSTSSKMRSDKC